LLVATTALSGVPIIVVGGYAVSLVIGVSVVLVGGRIDRVAVAVVSLFTFWTLLLIASRSVDPHVLATTTYWNGEGRAFVSYLPLVALAGFRASSRDLEAVVRGARGLVAAGVLLYLAVLLLPQAAFGQRLDLFTGLQSSHTGAGTFWGAIALFLLWFGWEVRSRKTLAFGSLAFLLTVATGSRAAVVAIVCAGIILSSLRGRSRRVVALISTVIVAILLSPIVAPSGASRIASLSSVEFARDVRSAYDSAYVTTESDLPTSEADSTAYNIATRVILWKYALVLTRTSPIIGVGFGRYNDTNLHFCCASGVVSLATDGTRNYSDEIVVADGQMVSPGNAHNSYLHLLAETGVVGLIGLLALWVSMYRRLRRTRATANDAVAKAYMESCMALIWFVVIAAFFGNALCAPSVVVPVLALCGLGLVWQKQAMTA